MAFPELVDRVNHSAIVLFGERKPVAYVLNPKAGCTLALNFLFFANHGYRYFDPIQIHYSPVALRRLQGEESEEAAVESFKRLGPETFSIVRDPLQRLISGFVSKIFSADDPHYFQLRDTLTSAHDIDLSPDADQAKSCLAFANWIAAHDPAELDLHFRPQYINLQTGQLEVDTILRLENTNSIIEFFSKYLEPDKAELMVSLRWNATDHTPKDGFVSDELVCLAHRIYARDYELFYPHV